MQSTKQSPMTFWNEVHSALSTWHRSGLENVASLDDAINSLENWLNQYPAHARQIQQVALSVCYVANIRQMSEAIKRLGQIGLDAGLIHPELNEEDRVSAALFALLAAQANLNVRQAAEGEQLLDYASQTIRSLEPKGSLKAYLLLQLYLLRGTFSEAALEFESAARNYYEAVQAGTPLVRLPRMFDTLAEPWLQTVFGNGPELVGDGQSQAIEFLRTDVSRAFTRATLGFARTTKEGATRAAQEAIDACERYGLTMDESPLALRQVLNHLSVTELDSAVERLLPIVERLPNEKAQTAFRAMLYSTQGLKKTDIDEKAGIEAFRRAGSEMKKARNALTNAICISDLITANFSRLSEGKLVEGFLLAFGQAAQQLRNTPAYLPFKAHFDSTMAILVEWAFDKCVADPSQENRGILSVLIDTLHSPLSELPPKSPEPGSIDEGLALALDRIQRASFGVQQMTDTAAVILQSVKDETLFICVTGDAETPLLFERSGPDYQFAARELAQQLKEQIGKPTADGNEHLKKLGQAVLKALPRRTRSVIKKKSTLLFVPDFRSDQDGIPFELFHDGKEFLGLSKVVTRFLSLRDLLHALESKTTEIEREQRALCIAASRIKGLPELSFADMEIEEIRGLLVRGGWEVPTIDEEDVDVDLLLEAAELASVVHIAAHGTIYAGGEALLLPEGRKLLVSDIENKPQFLRSFVFLNTCSLGQSRYLGGGVSKGIAYALLSAYTPCVIANLMPVYDKSATLLSAAFYEQAQNEIVGEALRKARGLLAQVGVPAAHWSSTIMIGSPFYSLYRANQPTSSRDTAVKLLKGYLEGAGEEAWSKDWNDAIHSYAREPENTRLGAAMLWVMNAAEASESNAAESLAQLAREISFIEGEAEIRYAIATRSKDPTALDAAIKVLEPLAATSDLWQNALRDSLSERQRLSIPREPEAIQYPLSVNDQSDPLVRAAFDVLYSLDQTEVRRKGKVSVRRPETSLKDLAWNAVVIGQQVRFSTEYSHIEFAAQFAQKLRHQGFIKSEAAETHARRLVAGFLPFLWESQHSTHLQHTHAVAQWNVFLIELESVIANWEPPESSPAFAVVQPIATKIQNLIDDEREQNLSKYGRALQLLDGKVDKETLGSLEVPLREAIESLKEKSAQAQADCAAWITGFLLDASHSLYGDGDVATETANRLLDLHNSLRRDEEMWFQHYLFAGYSRVPQDRLSFLYRWRVPEPEKAENKTAGAN